MLSTDRRDLSRRCGQQRAQQGARRVRLALFFWSSCLLTAVQADNVDGAWSAVYEWPLISVHAALTPDARVLTYGTKADGTQTGLFIYDVWDPALGHSDGHLTMTNLTTTDIFCSSQIILPQSGDIFIAGGDNWTGTGTTNTGNKNSNIFSYGSNTLARSSDMNSPRWYSSSTVLLNGEVYIQGGSGGEDHPEVRQLDGSFRLLTNANTSSYARLFPRNFMAPDGRIFGFDSNGKMYFVDPAGTGSLSSVGQFPSGYAGWQSSPSMFRPGKILQMGANSNGALVIDINGPIPAYTPTAPMSSQRRWVNNTLLPDGKVLATGGSRVDNELTDVNNSAEIWDPDTGTWQVGSSGAKPRLYHSSGLLLPDASVLVSGGGAPGPEIGPGQQLTNTNAEIYYPPYLYAADGSFAPRPEIVSAPTVAEVGDNLNIIAASDDVARVTLVKTGSTTHSFNMDQRFLELPFVAASTQINAQLPTRTTDTPPGFYQLFLLNAAGVPSHARMLRINIDATPNIAVDYTPTIGGGGGGAFQLACASDEVLVGVHGRALTYINQIGPQCVRMDQLGRWIGSPVNGPVTGTATSGSSFSRTCPQDYAVSGFRGRAEAYVNQLEIQCRALTPSGGLAGDPTYLGADGGNGGNLQGPQDCSTQNPVYAIYGRSGSWMDSFGMQCRQAVVTPISINSTPVIVNPGPQSDTAGDSVSLQISASDGDFDDLNFAASGLPTGLSIDPDSGLISGEPSVANTYSVTVTVSDAEESDNASFSWQVNPAPPLVFSAMPSQPAQPLGNEISYIASASGGQNTRYAWDFGDGLTDWSETPTASFTFSEAGIHYITLMVDDDLTSPQFQNFVQNVHLPLTGAAPDHSSKLVYQQPSEGNPRIWVLNQDNDSVSVFDAVLYTKLAEIDVGKAPRALAIAPDGRVWVSNHGDATISIIDPGSLGIAQILNLPMASQPYGIAFAPDANAAFIALEGTGSLLKLDAGSGAQLSSVELGMRARHLSVTSDESSVYVARFMTGRQPGEETQTVLSEQDGQPTGGEVLQIDPLNLTIAKTIILQHSAVGDAEDQGNGVPNYLGAPVISPDGSAAWVPSKQDNIARGKLRNNLDLNFQNTVRAISSRIDLAGNTEDYPSRIDHDNASMASAAAFDPYGIYLFVALETSREIAVVDVHGGFEMFKINVGRAPQGVLVSPDGGQLFVSNFMDRSITVYDLTALRDRGDYVAPLLQTLPTVNAEQLSADVLLGKQLFYDAADDRLARDNYMSCASCHNDGGHDNRIWDLTSMGEGLRNTISLRGSGAGHGPLHWSANFDEVHDFEGQIRVLSEGSGLMDDLLFETGTVDQSLGDPKVGLSDDLDALAAYVASLNEYPDSPYRNTDGSMTASAVAGEAVFIAENCASCHRGNGFTDSAPGNLHDIGTLNPVSSGQRLNSGPLPGVDTPTLRGLWLTAPYLHDGSAETLADAVARHNGVSLSATEMVNLVTYLEQIDDHETAAPAPDGDADGVDDNNDNCLMVANTTQLDANDDGFGNRCDADMNGDGIVNFADLAIFKSRFGSADAEADLDGNGFVNFADLAIFKSRFGKTPGPSALAP
jgi:YVTN family beta-propeller protein